MNNLELPNTILTWLESVSQVEHKRPSDVIVDLVLSSMDTSERLSTLIKLSQEFEEIGDSLITKDLVEAGEAYWRSLSYLMRAVALNMGFEIATYQDHYAFIEYLAYKLGKGSLVVSFVNAERLHGEFHPRPQSPEEFEFRKNHLKSLLVELRYLINELKK
ncbi:PaREP1 family protein [Metallosphaera hakonensis]|uniref:Uncharacterized protein n=1 Tax=Metallosphaera hakonensis JCM 8857 = DSM 7519 TaxID=1293036 RepID=A0A2U9ISU8_9CREN|nr:PaREP1 family protein [Metallosphaera hakonensis]AWR99129.1 hypothetical protein DFR87_04805 [Metallosphaera hakonensis JCM 8857 = DSM 7519]